MNTIIVYVNGEERQVPEQATISDLLREMKLNRQACAVEVNLHLVPKAGHAAHRLMSGDRLEVVSLVGGG